MSLAFGFLSSHFWPYFSISALILGVITLVSISKEKNGLKGRGLAIGGIVFRSLGIILISFVALLSAIATLNLLKVRMLVNGSAVKATIV